MPLFIDIDPSATPAVALGINARVELNISRLVDLQSRDGNVMGSNYSLVFYTEARPLYASVDYILIKGGDMLEGIPEAALYIMSFAASTMADDIILFDEDTMFPDKTTQTWKFYNRAKTEFACCQSIAGVLRAVVASRGTAAGRKTLADFSIDTGAMANIAQSFRPYLKDLTDECKWWRGILYAAGAADHDAPAPLAAVKSGSNIYDTSIGIGRGWSRGTTLNVRQAVERAGNSWNRPSRIASPRFYQTNSVWWEVS